MAYLSVNKQKNDGICFKPSKKHVCVPALLKGGTVQVTTAVRN